MKVIEKLRRMTTDEVAEVIYRTELSEYGEFDTFCQSKLIMNSDDELVCPYNYERCKECICEWLESEVEEK